MSFSLMDIKIYHDLPKDMESNMEALRHYPGHYTA